MGSLAHHGEIPLPDGATGALANRAGALQGVAPALGAVERHVVIGPRNAARKAARHLEAQLLYR